MSSHREAPEITKDPVADNTDLYAFVSPDGPTPSRSSPTTSRCEDPAGGPNFFEFGDDVLYEIHIDNDGDGEPDIVYQFRFTTEVRNPNTFLYNTGPIDVARRARTGTGASSTRSRARIATARRDASATDLAVPAVQHRAAVDAELRRRWRRPRCTTLGGGETVFAGQRNEGFYVDLGSIFDLGDLRPFQNLHLIPTAGGAGRRRAAGRSTCTRSRSRSRSAS